MVSDDACEGHHHVTVSYDRDDRRVVMDIAIDGPGPEDPVSDVLQLCRFFRTRSQSGARLLLRGTEREVEWLNVECGVVDGIPVRCRVFSLPHDDPALREALLQRSDAAIFVCDLDAHPVGELAARARQFAQHAQLAGSPPVVLRVRCDPLSMAQLDTVQALQDMLANDIDAVAPELRETMMLAVGLGLRHAPGLLEKAARDLARDDKIVDDC